MNMRWRVNSCSAQRESASLLASGALPENEAAAVREHLAICSQCRVHYKQVVRLSSGFKQWASRKSSVEVGAAFETRWMRSIQAENDPAAPWLRNAISRCRECLWPSPLAWGGLAAVWLCLLCLQSSSTPEPNGGRELARNVSRPKEVTLAQRQRERFAKNPEAANQLLAVGMARLDEKLDARELAAWTVVAQTVLNLDEAITKR